MAVVTRIYDEGWAIHVDANPFKARYFKLYASLYSTNNYCKCSVINFDDLSYYDINGIRGTGHNWELSKEEFAKLQSILKRTTYGKANKQLPNNMTIFDKIIARWEVENGIIDDEIDYK